MPAIIYISGIPYDQTEEQVLDVASSVGPVVSSKLLFDRETGKSKGVCLIEYKDKETASSAVRNLSNTTMGGENNRRYLKCNFATTDSVQRMLQGESWSGGGGFHSSAEQNSRFQLEREIPPLPAGATVRDTSMAGLNDVIYQALTRMDSSRLRNLVEDARIMARDNPQLMQVLLERNPQLVYALVESCLLLNIATPEKVKGLLKEQQDGAAKQPPEEPAAESIESMSPEQQQAIKTICAMSEEQIREQVADAQQQELYLEIRRKYGRV